MKRVHLEASKNIGGCSWVYVKTTKLASDVTCKLCVKLLNLCTNCSEEIRPDKKQCSDCNPVWLQDK